MTLPFVNTIYTNAKDQVSWKGLTFNNSEDFSEFLQKEVADRLKDMSARDEFHSHLRGLALTGMGKDNLEEVLNAEIPEDRTWAVGEALAEALLIHLYGVIFPWNMKRDQRNAKASLPGADIVGFFPLGSEFRLALGEVKTSGEEKYPPQIMSSRSGHMGHQIDNLANNISTIYQLLYWLLPRVKGTEYETAYNKAVTLYLNSEKRAASLFGILIRDTEPIELDLSVRGNHLGNSVVNPTFCELIAVYLPCKISDLPVLIEAGEVR